VKLLKLDLETGIWFLDPGLVIGRG
jgi:hypothetical protein